MFVFAEKAGHTTDLAPSNIVSSFVPFGCDFQDMMIKHALATSKSIITPFKEAAYRLTEIDFSRSELLMHGEDNIWLCPVAKFGESLLFATGPASTQVNVEPLVALHHSRLEFLFGQWCQSISKLAILLDDSETLTTVSAAS